MARSDSISSISSAEQNNIIFEALPGFNLINDAVSYLKGEFNNSGERGCTTSKAVAYLGFRLVSYSLLPLALNTLSAVISGFLCLITLPTRCCCEEVNDWCWTHFQGSLSWTAQGLFDLSCDFRQITGPCFFPPDSLYLSI
ncbi:MAG: hypothetical protein H0T62_05455 [Parachlamydiaceae bacterium]|nr:hypothetical protein [Parachlamydiaceae bacterium]